MIPWVEVAKEANPRYKRLCLVEVTDLALEHLRGKENIRIPVFTKIKSSDWFVGIERLAPRSQRQL